MSTSSTDRRRRPRRGRPNRGGPPRLTPEQRERRTATVPEVTYPADLPVSEQRDDIAAAIRDHQVVIVAGETGSGKTTQLPKICLELGRGVDGVIGHTQPRRIAARTVAERIAEELGQDIGEAIGYQVRFTRRAGEDTLVKVMTDGVLLAEMTRDRMLRRYDTIIIDEAHERSLNIDFILGYLKSLLPRRPDLKVIITSATIDPERFSRHFDDAPIVEVSGRTYPVEVRYRPLEDDSGGDADQVQGILDACDELMAEGPGDILVFLSGEREIRDAADALRSHVQRRDRSGAPPTEVLPLYARLSSAEQHRVFQSHRGRRIVLATNVAETSLTVPGIHYVVDTGTARISRYSHRLKVQRLPIEPISQASARQRSGRSGRLAPGICIRLYDEEDFDTRPTFTEPEILRTNLASVILQMTALGLGEIADFPFLDPPDRRAISDGLALLHELGAIDPDAPADRRLTATGRSLADLPIDPRFARMIVEAKNQGCVREVLVIVAALTIQDPRERPAESRVAADQSHARFAQPTSDFLTYLALWQYLREQQKARSGNQFRKMCRAEYLNYLRVREWQDLEGQLRQLIKPLGITLNDNEAEPDAIHRALLAGLLSHIGVKEGQANDYLGARGAHFAVFPGSALAKKPPRWVMAAELVETSRLWGRENARIEPEWAEPLAAHLVKRVYSEPHWSKKSGAAIAYEKVLLYGVPIVSQRRIPYHRVDPEAARDLFIRHALVEGDWTTHHRFFHDNRALLDDVEELEHRARRRDILVDDETLVDFYDQRIPADVVSTRHFDSWWKKAQRADPSRLTFDVDLLVKDDDAAASAAAYPDTWSATVTGTGSVDLSLTYQFEPGAHADGVTVHIPLPLLAGLEGAGFDWQVPGLREELVIALIKALPKSVRRSFVPVPDTAREVLPLLEGAPDSGAEGQTRLTEALGTALQRWRAVPLPADAWDWDRVPDHLKMTFAVEDDSGRVVAEGKDLAALRASRRTEVRQTITAAAADMEQTGLTEWSFGTLPRTVERPVGDHLVVGYPALVDDGSSVSIRVWGTTAEQAASMRGGTRRLLLLSVPSPTSFVQRHLTTETTLVLSQNPDGSVAGLLDDIAAAAVDDLVAEAGGPAWDEAGFTRLRDIVRSDLIDAVFEMVGEVERILAVAHRIMGALRSTTSLALAASLVDARSHLAALTPANFVTRTGRRRLPALLRYLRALERRLEKLPASPQRDQTHLATVQRVADEYQALLADLPVGQPIPADVNEIRWQIEELRVSLFAQEVGTPAPVSEKRIIKAIDAAADAHIEV